MTNELLIGALLLNLLMAGINYMRKDYIFMGVSMLAASVAAIGLIATLL